MFSFLVAEKRDERVFENLIDILCPDLSYLDVF